MAHVTYDTYFVVCVTGRQFWYLVYLYIECIPFSICHLEASIVHGMRCYHLFQTKGKMFDVDYL